ncbi:hypothetical protein GS534_03960 [Rhodococcus hoagii]|nr:hypothetical protein [Prescottella equi]
METRIPTRFEQLVGDPTPLIVSVEDDLRSFDRLRRTATIQQGGVLAVLTAKSGTGKTTAVYSLASLMPEHYKPVFPVSSTVTLRDLPSWLEQNLPDPDSEGKHIPVLIDNREETDDDVGLGQLMSGLNGLLRRRKDLIALWPTTDPAWRDNLVEFARKVGGKSLLPTAGEVEVSGPPKEKWKSVLDLLLNQIDQTYDDLALESNQVAEAINRSQSVGQFLEEIRDLVVESVDEVRIERSLPRLVFVVTSDSSVSGEANRLRRAGTLAVKAEELVSYSSRSKSGLYWQARSENPKHRLSYIISLFQARLVTMSPSAVSYAVLQNGDEDLQNLAKEAGLARSNVNAATTFKSTDFYRFLTSTTTNELTSTSKGKTAPATLNAYIAIQQSSAKRHKAINQAICAQSESIVDEFRASSGRFEVDLGDGNAFADAVIPLRGEDLHLEFHHLSPQHCKASKMSSYIMDKLMNYAICYNLIPR